MAASGIVIGIDVDSSSVKTGDAAIQHLNTTLGHTEKQLGGIGKVGRAAAETIQRVGAAGKGAAGVNALARATAEAGHAAQKAAGGFSTLGRSVSATTSLIQAARGAMLGFIGASLIRGLMNTTISLQKIEMTFQAVTGSAEAAAAEMEYVRRTADSMGQDILSSAGAYAKLLAATTASGISMEDTRNLYEGLTAAATAYGLSQYELEGALNAVQQMASKGSVQAEELKGQLGERLPGAFAIAARSMQMSSQQLSKALEDGEVSAEKLIKALGPELQRQFQASAIAMNTTGKAVNDLGNAWTLLQERMIKGGFGEALAEVLDSITSLVASDLAFKFANSVGEAFKFAADNIVLATAAMTGFLALIGMMNPWVAAIVALSVAVAKLTIHLTDMGYSVGQLLTVLQHLIAQVGAAALVIGGKWVAAFVAARVGVLSLTVAVRGLGLALKTLWPYLLISLAVEGIMQLRDAGIAAHNAGADVKSLDGAMGDAEIAATHWASTTVGSARAVELGISASVNASIAKIEQLRVTMAEEGAFVTGGAEADPGRAAKIAEIAAETARLATETERLHNAQQASLAAERRAVIDRIAAAEKGQRDMEAAASEATKLSDATGGAAKGAKAMADEFERAKEILQGQQAALEVAKQKLKEGAGYSEFINEQTRQLEDALKDTGLTLDQFLAQMNLTREQYDKILADTLATNNALAAQQKLQSGIAGALKTAAGGDALGGATGMLESITGVFTDRMDEVFDEAGSKMAEGIQSAINSITGAAPGTPMSPMVAGIGAGIGTAAIGAMKGDAAMIGNGIGSAAGVAVGTFAAPAIAGAVTGAFGAAAGAAMGSVIPVVGTIIGGIIGSFIGGAIGGGDRWQSAKVTAFAGTSYAEKVKVRYNTENEGATPVARAAVEATEELLKDFNSELKQFVESLGGTMKSGIKLIVDQEAALKAITGFSSDWDAPRAGEGAEETANRIAEKVAEIMGLAALLVTKTVPPLTAAQQAWRTAQEMFAGENLEILKALGFTTKQINDALKAIKKEIAQTMEFDLVNMIINSGHATKKEIDLWKKISIANLKDWYKQNYAAAKELGVSTELVTAAYNAGMASINDEYADMMEDITDVTDEAAEKIAKAIEKISFSLDIMQGINAGSGATATSIKREYNLTVKLLAQQRKDAVAEAKRLGESVYWVNYYYDQELIQLAKDTAAELLAIKRQGTDFNLEMLNIIIGSGDATKAHLDEWLRVTKINLKDWLGLALKDAEEKGGSVKLVWDAYYAQIGDATQKYTDWLKAITDATVGVIITWREKADFTIGILKDLNQINDGSSATAKSIKAQYDLTLKINADNRKAAVAEAKRLGQDVAWVNALYDAKDLEALNVFNRQMADYWNRGLDDVITVITDKLNELQTELDNLMGQRSDVLEELTRRTEEARNAEQALADARKSLAVSELAPGGPLDMLNALQTQFGSAISRAAGGDASAASEAGSLAQQILQIGQQIFGSGSAYSDLFRSVNESLTSAQIGAGAAAEAIETQLDKETFSDLTKQSTEALLKALGVLDTSIKNVSAAIEDQTKKLAEAEAKRKVAA